MKCYVLSKTRIEEILSESVRAETGITYKIFELTFKQSLAKILDTGFVVCNGKLENTVTNSSYTFYSEKEGVALISEELKKVGLPVHMMGSKLEAGTKKLYTEFFYGKLTSPKLLNAFNSLKADQKIELEVACPV